MEREHGIVSCRFAEMTLMQPYPVWLAAEDFPWSCRRNLPARLIEDTETCLICPNWQSRSEEKPSHDRNGR